MMKHVRVTIILATALTVTCLAQSGPPTKDVECSELSPGQNSLEKTDITSNSTSTVRAYATAEVKRGISDKKADSCSIAYKLLVAHGREPFTVVKTLSEHGEWTVGVQIIGFSPDQSKLAADFWWAGGDYTGHRPVIYDVNTKRVQFRELGEQITGQLPSCDYFQTFTAVTNAGEAVIHVPKSTYVDEGCPDQGDWLFDVASGKVRRASTAHEQRRNAPTAANREVPCKTPANAASCYWTHGRLGFYNGTPAFRLWRVGTHRLLGIYSGPSVDRHGEDNEHPEFPANMKRIFKPSENRILADFEVCPLEPEQGGAMQPACIESAKNIVVEK